MEFQFKTLLADTQQKLRAQPDKQQVKVKKEEARIHKLACRMVAAF